MTTEDRLSSSRRATAHAHLHGVFALGRFTAQSQALKQQQRKQAAPARYPTNQFRLDEFTKREDPVPPPSGYGPKQPTKGRVPSMAPEAAPRPLEEPLSIRPMKLSNFLSDGLALYVSHVMHPSQIPGRDLFSRVYAMGLLPVLIIAMTIIQWVIGLLVIVVNNTKLGGYYYGIFFRDQIALFDETDLVDPEGNDEAVRQICERKPRLTTHFSYHIANLLLIMTSMAYQRDDKLVAQASKILLNVQNQAQRDEATKLLQESEQAIDENASKEFGMRFMGISELKTLGGPFAGLFYNDDAIVLVFKGTSVLAFNEYLLDVTIQRVDAREYLYGEVHKGFYESLFPDPKPLNWYEDMTYDQTNPFNTIMKTILETAKLCKNKTGKPVNLWMTGHSLGGALAALTMARLQMTVEDKDPLMNKDYDETNGPRSSTPEGAGPRTVLQEMLARFSDDNELLVLRDCYSIASPKIGDSTFAEQFARNHLRFCCESPYKPTYWRIVADKDVVPRLPPGCNVDPNEPYNRLFPFRPCPKAKTWLVDEKQEDNKIRQENKKCDTKDKRPMHLHSLLDYQHVGQLVKVYNAARAPKVKPSAFEADLSRDVLRKEQEVDALMIKLAKVASIWKAQDQLDASVNQSTNTATTVTMTTTLTGTATVGQEGDEKSQAETAQQIADDILRAQALYNIDELSRLRQPHLLERMLLKIPSLLSHAPVAYQRNLVRGRFYFKSFPGAAFEERLGQWLDQMEKETVSVDEGVEMASNDGDQGEQQGQVGLGKAIDVDVQMHVDVKLKDKDQESKALSNGSRQPVQTKTTLTQTVAMQPREE
ncbi:hypothetical protein BC939DRAFT_476502 [Gamsiella multidivaricata]|uniref:uncharacterized protein n=1 Tax=Gamsiella multidivaricata TaxID=101098 RepID=UPI002220517D|nr:uncharacterized protein BC939DRAFT_476502 [Gamsiella multidivaricata]KAG0364818.1 hypothetical protein BGZ54_007121 [Gamsiella multidivaricata]KAI7824793.1 hypothetical protein BC939DRAFT_476502 [Gamsiella multidivaricata]